MATPCICLWDVVGLSLECDTLNQCNRYINDLPGIEAGMFEDLTTADRAIYTDILDKVKRRAIGSFYTEMVYAFRKKFVPSSLIENILTGVWKQPFTTMSMAAELRGVAISLRVSKYMESVIDSIEIYVENSPLVDASIFVYDLERGTLLDTILFSAPSDGFYSIEIQKRYTESQIGIFYDANEVETRDTSYYDEGYYQELCKSCGCTVTLARPVSLPAGGDIIWNNLDNTYYPGMIAKYSVRCSLESFLCQHREILAEALMYKMGIEFFIELVASSRINITTLMPSEKIDALMSYCKKHFDKSLSTFVEGTVVNDPICMICKRPVQKATLKL